jgi:3-hydroxybutyryl-CoA dehydratase
MIIEKTKTTIHQLTNLISEKLINTDSYGVFPTSLQLQKEVIKSYRIFQYTYQNTITHLFLAQVKEQDNTFVSIYNFTADQKLNESQLYNFIDFCFQKLISQKLSAEIYDDKKSMLSSYLKMGFEIEGLFKKHILIKSKKRDVYRLALTKENFDKYIKNTIPKVLNGEKFNINIGDKYTENRIITQKDIELFAQVSDDQNPIHLDETYAKDQGFNSTIAHGILSASFISKILGMDFPGNGSIYLSQDLKFIKPIYPYKNIRIELKILSIVGKKITLSTKVIQNNQITIKGTAVVLSSQ